MLFFFYSLVFKYLLECENVVKSEKSHTTMGLIFSDMDYGGCHGNGIKNRSSTVHFVIYK